jgi:hypothetical protein
MRSRRDCKQSPPVRTLRLFDASTWVFLGGLLPSRARFRFPRCANSATEPDKMAMQSRYPEGKRAQDELGFQGMARIKETSGWAWRLTATVPPGADNKQTEECSGLGWEQQDQCGECKEQRRHGGKIATFCAACHWDLRNFA